MAVTIHIPSVLRTSCGDKSELSLSAANVQEALEQIKQDYPALYVSICNETGSLRPHVNLFINSSLVNRSEIRNTSLTSDDVLYVFQAVSGG